MRHRRYDDLAVFDCIDQKVGKPVYFLAPGIVSGRRARVWKIYDKTKRRIDFGVKFIA